MRMINLITLDNEEECNYVASFLSKNHATINAELRGRISQLTDERIDLLNIKILPAGKVYKLVVLLYKPNYLFSDIRNINQKELFKWLKEEIRKGLTDIDMKPNELRGFAFLREKQLFKKGRQLILYKERIAGTVPSVYNKDNYEISEHPNFWILHKKRK